MKEVFGWDGGNLIEMEVGIHRRELRGMMRVIHAVFSQDFWWNRRRIGFRYGVCLELCSGILPWSVYGLLCGLVRW